MRANQLERCARPRSGDNQPGGGMPKGIPVLVPFGCDAKTRGLPDEHGEITLIVRRQREEAAKSQDLLGQEERLAAAITPAGASLEGPGIGARVRQQDELAAEGPSCSSSKPLPCQL
jgi:hypothetical protein